eukprot:1159528-Pelagomonas_calceolata.AAC.5
MAPGRDLGCNWSEPSGGTACEEMNDHASAHRLSLQSFQALTLCYMLSTDGGCCLLAQYCQHPLPADQLREIQNSNCCSANVKWTRLHMCMSLHVCTCAHTNARTHKHAHTHTCTPGIINPTERKASAPCCAEATSDESATPSTTKKPCKGGEAHQLQFMICLFIHDVCLRVNHHRKGVPRLLVIFGTTSTFKKSQKGGGITHQQQAAALPSPLWIFEQQRREPGSRSRWGGPPLTCCACIIS